MLRVSFYNIFGYTVTDLIQRDQRIRNKIVGLTKWKMTTIFENKDGSNDCLGVAGSTIYSHSEGTRSYSPSVRQPHGQRYIVGLLNSSGQTMDVTTASFQIFSLCQYSHYIPSNKRMTENEELERVWKEVVLA
jgi:hypothetical protein